MRSGRYLHVGRRVRIRQRQQSRPARGRAGDQRHTHGRGRCSARECCAGRGAPGGDAGTRGARSTTRGRGLRQAPGAATGGLPGHPGAAPRAIQNRSGAATGAIHRLLVSAGVCGGVRSRMDGLRGRVVSEFLFDRRRLRARTDLSAIPVRPRWTPLCRTAADALVRLRPRLKGRLATAGRVISLRSPGRRPIARKR